MINITTDWTHIQDRYIKPFSMFSSKDLNMLTGIIGRDTCILSGLENELLFDEESDRLIFRFNPGRVLFKNLYIKFNEPMYVSIGQFQNMLDGIYYVGIQFNYDMTFPNYPAKIICITEDEYNSVLIQENFFALIKVIKTGTNDHITDVNFETLEYPINFLNTDIVGYLDNYYRKDEINNIIDTRVVSNTKLRNILNDLCQQLYSVNTVIKHIYGTWDSDNSEMDSLFNYTTKLNSSNVKLESINIKCDVIELSTLKYPKIEFRCNGQSLTNSQGVQINSTDFINIPMDENLNQYIINANNVIKLDTILFEHGMLLSSENLYVEYVLHHYMDITINTI